jgi:hypothetical protein
MRGWIRMRSSSSRLAATRRSSGCREARASSGLAPSVSVTVTIAVAASKASFSPTTA